MTTIKGAVLAAVKKAEYDNTDNLKKLVAMAYYIGRESATKEILDIHNARVSKARDKANTLRYHNVANVVLDAMEGDIIYHPDYAGDMTNTFGNDTTNMEV